MVRVGKVGKTITVGEKYKGTPGESGRLYFRVHPSPWANQMTGTYALKVMTGTAVEGRTPTGTPEAKKDEGKDFDRDRQRAGNLPLPDGRGSDMRCH